VTSPTLGVEIALEAKATLGEGPAWDDHERRLLWIDILDGLVHTFDPANGSDVAVGVGRPVGAIGLRAGGGLVLAVEDGFALSGPGGKGAELIAPIGADDPAIRFNDGKCDPAGRFWAGTMAYDETPNAAALYRLDPGGDVERVLDDVTISNGLAWTVDGRTMFFADTPTRRVDAFAFDLDAGTIRDRRTLLDLADFPGFPDGMAIDAEDCLWVAFWGGSSVRRFRPDGRPDLVLDLPATNVTSCAFGGPDLRDLYVTSARDGLSAAQLAAEPHAGAVFHTRTDVPGVPVPRFEG
jgi:sugar lactone lactonase YvrE